VEQTEFRLDIDGFDIFATREGETIACHAAENGVSYTVTWQAKDASPNHSVGRAETSATSLVPMRPVSAANPALYEAMCAAHNLIRAGQA